MRGECGREGGEGGFGEIAGDELLEGWRVGARGGDEAGEEEDLEQRRRRHERRRRVEDARGRGGEQRKREREVRFEN